MKEKREFRKECVKHFENADHTFTAAVYGQSVHYMKNGEWKDIDNSIVLNQEGRYENKGNDFQVSFAKEASDEKLITVSKDGHGLEWKLLNSLPAPIFMKKNKSKAKNMEVANLKSKVTYKNVRNGMDLEYILSSKDLKENIILSRPLEDGCLTFEIKTDLELIKKDNKIIFVTGEKESVFTMAAPYMFDADGQMSYGIDIQCHLMEEEGKILYMLIPDREWLNASERKWPVTIDPIISSSTDYEKIYDTRICSRYPNDNFVNDLKLVTGQSTSIGIGRSLINFELPELKPADMVIGAVFYVTCYSNYGGTKQIHLHRVLDEWDSTQVTWNTMPRYDSKIQDCNIFTDNTGTSVQFDVTELVKDWYANGKQYGVMLKDKDEAGNYTEYLSSDSSDAFAVLRPKVLVSYVNYTGIQNYWTYHSQDIRRAGTVYVNDYNGNLVFKHPVDIISGNRMPYELNLFYNSNDKGEDIGYGKGFRLNYHQQIQSKTLENVQYYEWIDGTGTRHYFRYDSKKGKWLDEQIQELELNIGTSAVEKYTVINKQENKLIFNSNGYLVKIKDINDNILTITYQNNRIKTVVDGSGRTLTMAYVNNHLHTVTNSAGRFKTFNYDLDGCLNAIQDFDGKELYLEWQDGLLSYVQNYDDYKMDYEYTSNPARVKRVKEYVGSVLKRSLSIEYGFNMNKFTDGKGRTETYMFNHAGNTISVKNDKGFAQTKKYMEEGEAINKLSAVSKLQYTTPQYLKNPNIFDSSEWVGSASSGTTVSINTDGQYVKMGKQSLKIDSTSIASSGNYTQTLSLEKGKTYTFSGYVRTANEIAFGQHAGALLRVFCKDANGSDKFFESRRITQTYGEWAFLDIHFTVPEDAASSSVSVSAVWVYTKGTAYFDAFQLEEGNVGNRRNLIENNDFSYGLTKFLRSDSMEDRDNLVDIANLSSESSGDSVNNTITGTVNADILNVRSGPGTGYSAITQISHGQMVTILDTTTGSGMSWYHIRFAVDGATYTGYVAAEYITLLSADVRTGTVNADILNMRTGPGTGYTAIAQLVYGTGVTILANASGDGMQWFQISVLINGTEYTGYVAAEYITETTSSGNGNGPVNTENIPVNPGALNSIAMRMVGNPQKEKRLSQTLSISGKAKEVFVVSAWGCGNPLPLKDNRAFGVELEFTHTDGTKKAYMANFKSDSNQWQYVSDVVIPEKDYSSIKASYVFNYNANTVYFDGMSVYKEEFWPSFTYDEDGKIISCTDAGNRKTTFAYDTNSNITKIITPSGSDFKYVYDSKHNVTEATTAGNRKYRFNYDSFGNVTSYTIVNPDNENQFIKKEYTYSSDGNYLAEEKDYFGNKVVYGYDANTGNMISITDAKNRTTSYTYDLMGRIVSVSKNNKVIDMNLPVTQSYTYENDQMKTITHNGMEYSFVYDGLGNMTQANVGNQTITMNTYKANSNLTDTVIYGNGSGISHEYDEFDRISKKYSVKDDGTKVVDFEYVYDNEGNLSYVIDKENDDCLHYLYNAANQMVRVENKNNHFVLFNYDENGKLKGIKQNYGEETTENAYEYDADYRETKTTTLGEKHLVSSYDAFGRLTSQMWDTTNMFTTYYGYRLGINNTYTPIIESIRNNGRGISYTYDTDGNITQILTDWTKTTYEYDNFGQLIRVNDDDTGHTTLYSYNAGCNMVSEKVYTYTLEEVPTTSLLSEKVFTYDSVWKDKMVTCGGKQLTYDAIGNLTSYDGVIFTWEKGRQLAGVTKSDGTNVRYTYNHIGKRSSKTIGSVKTLYTYVGNQLMREKSANVDMKFSYNTEGIAVAILYNGTEYYYVRNLQNDVIGLIDAEGNWVVEYQYDVWGNLRNIYGSLSGTLGEDNPLRYRGYYYDVETNLYYLGDRYYSPELKRFINADIIAGCAGQLGTHNLFAYCLNNPVNNTDIEGNWSVGMFQSIGIVVAKSVEIAAKKTRNIINNRNTLGVEAERGKTIVQVSVPGACLEYSQSMTSAINENASEYTYYRSKNRALDEAGIGWRTPEFMGVGGYAEISSDGTNRLGLYTAKGQASLAYGTQGLEINLSFELSPGNNGNLSYRVSREALVVAAVAGVILLAPVLATTPAVAAVATTVTSIAGAISGAASVLSSFF